MSTIETVGSASNSVSELLVAPEQLQTELMVLPIDALMDDIVKSFVDHQFIILEGPPGSGKTTRVPQRLHDEGYRVIATEPRVLATSGVAMRVRYERSITLGDAATNLVGYRTANERDDHPDNQISFFTHGLQLNHEISGYRPAGTIVRIGDEIHEADLPSEIELGYWKRMADADPNFKAVLMSATIDTELYANFFKDSNGIPAPVISIPGRPYKLEERKGGEFIDLVVQYARLGKSVLGFVGGKPQITKTINEISGPLNGISQILALHGDQTSHEQNKIYESSQLPKVIISTEIGSTSITISGIQVVVDSGWGRESEDINGINTLCHRPISLAIAAQRGGRAARTEDGIHHMADFMRGFPRLLPSQTKAPYCTPAIQKSDLTGMVLKLALAGDNFREFKTPHVASPENTKFAYDKLKRLGALAVSEEITSVGQDMEFLPLEPHLALSIVAARNPKYSEAVALHVAAAVAVQQAKGIVEYNSDSPKRWKNLSEDLSSDVLREMDVFVVARTKAGDFFEDHDITEKRFIRARDTYLNLCEAEQLNPDLLGTLSDKERNQVIECLIAGADELMVVQDKGYIDPRNTYRRLMPETSIPEGAMFVVGSPFILETMTEVKPIKGMPKIPDNMVQGTIKRIITIRGATAVTSIEQLERAAPERCSYRIRDCVIDKKGNTSIVKQLYFDDTPINHTISEAANGSVESHELLVRRIITGDLPKAAQSLDKLVSLHGTVRELRELAIRSLEPLDVEPLIETLVTNIVSHLPSSCTGLIDLGSHLPTVATNQLLTTAKIKQIRDESPESINVAGLILDVTYEPNRIIITVSEDSWNLMPLALQDQFHGRNIFLQASPDSTIVSLKKATEYAAQRRTMTPKQHARKAKALAHEVSRLEANALVHEKVRQEAKQQSGAGLRKVAIQAIKRKNTSDTSK